MEFSTDEYGKDFSGIITLEDDIATVTFTSEGWKEFADDLNVFKYYKTADEPISMCRIIEKRKRANVMEWLGCSKSKATNVMNVLKEAKVIEKVTGLGAGKYSFLKL